MLSFQKEQSGLPTQPKAQSNTEDSVNSPSENASQDKQQEYLTVANRQKQVRQSTYLLIVLFVIGLLTLLFMIKKSTPVSAKASDLNSNKTEQAQIEEAITRLTGVRSQMFSGLQSIVKKFYEFADFEQINVDELRKNPFRTDNFLGDLAGDQSDKSDIMLTVQNELELLSIMRTERGNCCMIDDKLLYEGDIIRGFTVSEITDSYVTLQSGEMQITLRLTDGF